MSLVDVVLVCINVPRIDVHDCYVFIFLGASAANKPPVGNAKPWLTKTYSSPQVNSSKPPIAKSPLAVQQEATESAQVLRCDFHP